jgi:NDP-sugar pyrophosphorylase family protein
MRQNKNSPFEAMVLVGGKGTRLQSVLSDRPKPMALIAGRPFLEWLLLSLRTRGIRRVILCTGHLGELVEAHFTDGHYLDIEVIYSQDPAPLGTAGAISRALGEVRGERFFVLNGDSYCRVDFERLTEVHIARSARATMWLVMQADCRRFGSVEIEEDGRVTAFREKSPEQRPGLINAGIYLLERETAESIPTGRAVSLETEFFPQLIGNRLYAAAGDGPFIDIGTPEAYASAEDFFASEWQARYGDQ